MLGSDGIWDVISNEIMIKRVHTFLSIIPKMSIDEIAEEICNLAVRLGSGDNITLVIIVFRHDD